jgi:thiamine biosynthesis lipoprotein
VEKKISRFLPKSELSKVNQEKGTIYVPSALLFELLSESLHYYEATDHLFSPFLQQKMIEIGYHRSFEQLHGSEAGTEAEFYNAYRKKQDISATYLPIKINHGMKSICLATDAELDLGGIAKGWTAQKMKDWLLADGMTSGLLDAGGDLALWGQSPDRENWVIGLANPFHQEEDIGSFTLHRDCGIATSSSLKRCWINNNREIAHHIIDPRTGWSAQSDYVQVTLFLPNLTAAEVYAKCLFILGSDQGPHWMNKKQPDAAWIAIRQDGAIEVSPSLKTYCSNWEFQA